MQCAVFNWSNQETCNSVYWVPKFAQKGKSIDKHPKKIAFNPSYEGGGRGVGGRGSIVIWFYIVEHNNDD